MVGTFERKPQWYPSLHAETSTCVHHFGRRHIITGVITPNDGPFDWPIYLRRHPRQQKNDTPSRTFRYFTPTSVTRGNGRQPCPDCALTLGFFRLNHHRRCFLEHLQHKAIHWESTRFSRHAKCKILLSLHLLPLVVPAKTEFRTTTIVSLQEDDDSSKTDKFKRRQHNTIQYRKDSNYTV